MPITDKQWTVINMIESNLDLKFRGSTFDEGKEFISSHIEQSKQVSSEYARQMRLLRLEEMEIEFDQREGMTEDEYFKSGWLDVH
ncbi:hypothetical protein P4597_27655 [Peribacillus simplex]|uniref:hypothetical protein n=1 Tax=Peribacillus simplex TaxID=1478 RepID=UPI002E1EE788|nr:hypothetical protein [Peribacillus simplex]